MESVNSKLVLNNEYKIIKVLQELSYGNCYLGMGIHNPEDRWVIEEVLLNFKSKKERLRLFNIFEEAAYKCKGLKHPLLVPLADYFNIGDHEYIIFEFIPGHRLGEVFKLRTKPFSEQQVLDFALKVSDALMYIHKYDIIFRDLNPSNIIITPEGKIKITGFGLGKILLELKDNKPKWGTEGYSPLEQYGKEVIFNPGIDIFALGTIMRQMITLEDPINKKGELIYNNKSLDISSEINMLISNATLDNPLKRYSNMQEFVKDLQKIKSLEYGVAHELIQENWLVKLVKELTKPFKNS